MLFASLVFERIPLHWGNLTEGVILWVQNAGGVAALGVALVLLARALQRDPNELNFLNLTPGLKSFLPALKVCIFAAGVGYGAIILLWIGDRLGIPGLRTYLPRPANAPFLTIGDWILTASGLLALLVALSPIAIDVTTRISVGRIWAIARLSWKEAIRGRVIWVFGAMALVFLFADWFVPAKAEDQLRSYVRVVYWSMTPLFLITAALLGSFSIPNDVNNNSIHTIVTKPVEKFEIVLGRFLGYAGLLTIGLAVVSGLSLIYVLRGVNAEAAQESFKARVPLYGQLSFVGTKSEFKGDDVGREWSPRSYITGPTKHRREPFRQYAVWDFAAIPASSQQQTEEILFEFAFDIFRLSKGEKEGEGVNCSFTFVDVGEFASPERERQAQELDGKIEQMKNERDQKRQKLDEESTEKGLVEKEVEKRRQQIELDLTSKYKIYREPTVEVTDYHTQSVAIPAAAFQALLKGDAERKQKGEVGQPALRVFVSVDPSNQAQMVGVAPPDFYLLPSIKPFWQNFLKGVLGMWFTFMLVLAIAIACSTYLSGVISLLLTLILYIAGLNMSYLRDLAERRVDGGGPVENSIRLATKLAPASPLDNSPTTSLVKAADSFFSWWVGRILNLIPDIERHDLHQYVAQGFDIDWVDVLLLDNALPLFGYLAPWAILAYYLMKFREIANPR